MNAQPFEPQRWDLVAGKTAAVIIHPQNDFLHADGRYAQSGVDVRHMQPTSGRGANPYSRASKSRTPNNVGMAESPAIIGDHKNVP